MTQIKVYPGYPLDNDGRWVGITEDHQFVTGQGDNIQPVGGWGKHPLAHAGGLEMFITLLNVGTDWADLTKAQQRCLRDPDTRTARPWQTLIDKGLANADGLSARGWFLRLAKEWIDRPKQDAA